MFEKLQKAPPDPILGLAEAVKKDPNPNKIDLGVGVYQDESGRTPIFSAVKKAERRLLEAEVSKVYLPISGSSEYAAMVQRLVFGAGSEIVASKRAATAQAPGGTGALRVAGDLLRQLRPGASVWVSDPTWSNHFGVFEAAGFKVATYPYYDAKNRCLAADAMLAAFRAIPEGDIVLLHASCHNPTGIDPTAAQWKQIAEAVRSRGLMPLLDFAYQGFGNGLEEDAAGVRLVCGTCPEALVASSFSKNFGLYNERVGALTAVCGTADAADATLSHLKIVIRQNYSNPPAHGAAVVAAVLGDPALRAEWERELAAVRARIHELRALLVESLRAKGLDFAFLKKQTGIFSYSGLSKEQVQALRERHSIYMVGSGRINVAGMNRGNVGRLCDAIAEVVAGK